MEHVHTRLYKDAKARNQVKQALLTGTEVSECLNTLQTMKTAQIEPRPPKQVVINLEEELEKVEQPMLNSAHDRCEFTKKMYNGAYSQLRLQLQQDTPPADFLQMNVLQRNLFWDRERQRKLQMQRKSKVDPALKDCTFTPTLKRGQVHSSLVLSKRTPPTYSSQFKQRTSLKK